MKELWGFFGTLLTIIVSAIISTNTVIRTRRRDEAERALVPKAELDLECRFYGPEQGEFVTDLRIIIENKGHSLRSYHRIFVRLRGLKAGAKLENFSVFDSKAQSFRLKFPERLVEEELLRPVENSIYTIEPGVKQTFTFPTKIPADIQYVLFHVKLVSPRVLRRKNGFAEGYNPHLR
jgi:hypothetical protein